MFKRILIPLDGSSLAEMVLPTAVYIAERLQAALILFHVVEKAPPTEMHGQHHGRLALPGSIFWSSITHSRK